MIDSFLYTSTKLSISTENFLKSFVPKPPLGYLDSMPKIFVRVSYEINNYPQAPSTSGSSGTMQRVSGIASIIHLYDVRYMRNI